jgi:uncharacterized protein YkwD
MLAGLVLASFTMTPTRRAEQAVATAIVAAAPIIEGEPAAGRIAPMSRGLARALRYVDDLEIAVSSDATADAIVPATGVAPEALPEPIAGSAPETTVESAPQATTKPEPATTPDPTPRPTQRPTPRPTPPPVVAVASSTTLAAEVHMLDLMNASRTRGGLVPLVMDVGVADTARAHSAAEARVRYVYHDGPDGAASSRDVPACGTGWYGENTGKIWNENVDALHIEFMNEPWAPINHRTNIMDPAFRRVGVGAVNGPDAMYMTMVFCR